MNIVSGLIALTFAILSIYKPIFGVWTMLISAIFAVFSTGKGFWLGVVAIVLNLAGLLSLSQTIWIKPGFAIPAVFLVIAQIAAMTILIKRQK